MRESIDPNEELAQDRDTCNRFSNELRGTFADLVTEQVAASHCAQAICRRAVSGASTPQRYRPAGSPRGVSDSAT